MLKHTILRNVCKLFEAWYWWLTPIIQATWEAEIRRITVPGQPRKTERLQVSRKQLGR
jgi:hypothetical protein